MGSEGGGAVKEKMKAAAWESEGRAMVFGMMVGVSFWRYSLDKQNVSSVSADGIGRQWHLDGDSLVSSTSGWRQPHSYERGEARHSDQSEIPHSEDSVRHEGFCLLGGTERFLS